jgi:hypothetical protein
MLRQTEKLLRQGTVFAAVTAVLGHHTPHIPELCISSNMLSSAYSGGWAKIAMMEFKSFRSARVTRQGIKPMHRIKKGLIVPGDNQALSIAGQFYSLAA